MFRTLRFPAFPVFAFVLVILAFGTSRPALAVDRGSYSMEILVDGVPLREYAARGTTYIEARKSREYSVRLTNHTPERIAIALSVDGLNSIDAKTTTASDARKWLLDPYETITLGGWQTSTDTARKFFFTSEEKSYGSWLGKTKNLGIIAAAVFRERRPVPPPCPPARRFDGGGADNREGARQEAPSAAPMNEPSESRAKDVEGQKKSSRLDELAATGIGREIDHQVREVSFDEEDSPTTTLEIRYEYRDALARLGVVPYPRPRREDPLARREQASGFDDFAPDPYRGR